MDNYELAAKFRGKVDGVKIFCGVDLGEGLSQSPATICDHLAYSYYKDVGELCFVLENIPDKEGDLQSAQQLNRFYESLMCPCGCNDPSVTVSRNEAGTWTAQCNKCQLLFVVKPKPEKK